MLSGNSVVFQIQGGTGRFAPCRFWMFYGIVGRTVPDGLCRATFVCFMALPEGARCSDSLARLFPGADQVGRRDCFLRVGTSVSRGVGKGYDSGSFPQRFRGRVRLGPALPDFRF